MLQQSLRSFNKINFNGTHHLHVYHFKKAFMKKIIFIILFIFIAISCNSYKVNLAFNLMGIYADSAKLDKLKNNQKEIVFIAIHHIGTKPFYSDIKKKIDSLENLGFHFYTEKIKGDAKDTTALLKLRKFSGIPFSKKNSGYLKMIDSMYNGKVKYKKELIDQPSYTSLGVDSLKSKNVDVTINEMINYYESKYGEIKLEKCDYETQENKKSSCKGKSLDKKKGDDAIINFRNKHVIEELLKDKNDKIVIVYGARHIIGIKEELLKLGYK